MSFETTVRKVRQMFDGLDEVQAVYAQSEEGAEGLPIAINSFPAICIWAGSLNSEEQMGGYARTSYTVVVEVLTGPNGGEVREHAAKALRILDRMWQRIRDNTVLGGNVTAIRPLSMEEHGVRPLWADLAYVGYALRLLVQESGAATYARGANV